ncbi:DUF2452 domain-containing protein [Spirosoma jeollabukense]
MEEAKVFINPISPDKVAESPGLLAYAHTAGSAVIRPEDKGKITGRAVAAMREQTDMQLSQLYKQMQLLAEQATAIRNRVEISERIYSAQMSFEPVVGHTYHFYQRKNGTDLLSMIGPNEWGRKFPFERCLATVRMMADHTWDVHYHETTYGMMNEE